LQKALQKLFYKPLQKPFQITIQSHPQAISKISLIVPFKQKNFYSNLKKRNYFPIYFHKQAVSGFACATCLRMKEKQSIPITRSALSLIPHLAMLAISCL